MGSWTTGALGLAGLTADMALGAGQLALGFENNKVNQDLAKLQMQALQLNLQLQKDGLDLSKEWNDPAARYEKAVAAGYDPISARQLAGAGFAHFSGGVAMQPIKSIDATALKYSNFSQQALQTGRVFTEGVGRAPRPADFTTAAFMHQSGQDSYTSGSWRPPSSSWGNASRHWGSESTRSTVPSVPSWAKSWSSTSTPVGSITMIPGSAVPKRSPLPKTWASVAGSFQSTKI